MNRDEYMRQLQWQIASLYQDHQLLSEVYWDGGRGARWLIGKPGTRNMLSEIIAGTCGSLVVHGDCDLSRFAHYGDHADAFSRLCWMGFCRDVGYYAAQKASIGMGRSGRGSDEYDEDVAKHDIQAYIGELKAEGDFQRRDQEELIELLTESLEWTENERDLRGFLSERDKWDLWEHTFGRVVATPVITGHLALQRCAYLLVDKYGDEGPPECRPSKGSAA